jgi:hypothetical protein
MRSAQWSVALAMVAFLLVAVPAVTAGTAAKAAKVAAISVDGDVADWSGVPVVYLENGPRVTALAHDDRFLYVYFRFSDPNLARRVLRTGAIVWVNPKDKHKAEFGVRYRGTAEAQQTLDAMVQSATDTSAGGPPPGGSDSGSPRPGGPPPGDYGGHGERGPRPEPAPLGALEVIHYGVADEVIASGAKEGGPGAACRVVEGAFTYELRIPLAEIAAASGEEKPTLSGKIGVGFQMGGLTPAERDAMREQMGRGGHEGFGSPGGGGPPGGGFGGGGFPGGGPPGGAGMPGEGAGRSRGGPFGSEPIWLDVELLSSLPAAATK